MLQIDLIPRNLLQERDNQAIQGLVVRVIPCLLEGHGQSLHLGQGHRVEKQVHGHQGIKQGHVLQVAR